ncbi:MAG: gfo/Idh/MocA family oxidoreductase [Chloroflexi bacterium]|nr:MAG: gfo/Idh/MocA family oxidoreductase [Phototrophicales bacterium]RMF79605.1 MAG: gfo/Idh/MocA family oxidoreductase [Chloroflexota bacterium]
MAEQVNIGIIGTGQIGKYHIENYHHIAGANLVAVADINEAEARRVAEKYNIPYVYSDFHKLLQRDDIVAVDVALHNNLHAPVTIAALQAGKHVYCEKPMAGAYIDAERMLAIARETGCKLSIQLARLFDDSTRAAKILIDAGKLGKLYHARSTGFRRRNRPYVDGYGSRFFVQKDFASGGAMYDMGVYHISRILYLLGNPDVRTISGNIYQEIEMDAERQQASGFNVEELGVGYVRFVDNISLDIIESWAIHLDGFDGSSVVGSDGGVKLEPFGYYHNVGDLELNSSVDLSAFNNRIHLLRDDADAYDGPQHHWVAALQGRVALLPTAEIALNTMLISEGIYLSHERGAEVTAEEVRELSQSTAIEL